MTAGFGTDNVIFVPRDHRLIIWDIYNWVKISVDVHRSFVRLRDPAFEVVRSRVTDSLSGATPDKPPKNGQSEKERIVERFLRSLRTAQVPPAQTDPHYDRPVPSLTWWVRLSDEPAESFFDEDYGNALPPRGRATAYPVYGSAHLSSMEDFELPLPGEGPNAPIWLLLPVGDGLTIEPIKDTEPLPLVHEYCGANGVSSLGNSINITCGAEIAGEHMGCCPIRRIAENTYATLYFHYAAEGDAKVCLRLSRKRYRLVLDALRDSEFSEVASGETWRVFERKNYVVHLYNGLEGKESAGVPTLPPFLVVGQAGGNYQPSEREKLLRQILDVTAP